jgi:predicted phage replisome organizer
MRRDFFKRHDIRILESLPNGKEYSLFYIKLMLESIDHNGELRYSKKQPYTIPMLCSITDVAKEVVEMALATLEELELVEVAEDGTYIIPHVAEMIYSVVDSDDANRQRRSRENRRQRASPCDTSVTGCHKDVTDVSQHCHDICDMNVTNRNESIDIEKEIEIDKEKENKKKCSPLKRFAPPSLDEVQAYCSERKNGIDSQSFIDFYASKGWMVGKTKMQDWKAAIRTWESRSKKQDKPFYDRTDYGNPEDIF